MNRIYKVIYSKARQCSIVVSELAKSCHKNSRKGAGHVGTPALARMVAAVLAAGALTWGIVPGVSLAAPNNDQSAVVIDNSSEDTDAVNVAQLKAISNTVDASRTKYYSVNDSAPGAIFDNEEFEKKYTNKNNDGAKSYYAMAAGYGTYAAGDASTVIGSYSVIQNDKVKDGDDEDLSPQGATAVSVGSFNFNLNTTPQSTNDFSKWYSGTANSIVGQGNLTKDSNGVLIYGAGNKITNSYRGDVPIDMLVTSMKPDVYQNPESFMDKVGEAVLQSGGQVMAIGGGNVADKAYMTQLMGVGNKVQGADITFTPPELQNDEDDYERYITAFNSAFNTQATRLNYVDGFYNKLTNAKNDYVIGMANDISGDDVSSNKSNIVIGDFHQMKNGSNNIILGSQDGNLTQKRYNTDGKLATEESVNRFTHQENLEDAVMIGHNAEVQKNGGVALGYDSIASTEDGITGGITGFDALGMKHISSDKDYSTWVSTDAAVSVGGADREVTYDVLDKDGKPVIDKATGKKKQETQIVNSTRQITNVAAGTEGTDAANVAQLKTVDKKIAVIFDDKGSLKSTDAEIKHEILQDSRKFPQGEGQSIAIGKGASAFMQGGWKSYFMLFGMEKAAGAIAIGEGAQALSQSIDIGNRTYTGEIGDVKISDYGNWGTGSGVASVLLGTNSYTGGTLSTLIGDYSIMSTGYPNGYGGNSGDYLQNAGAVSVGALNSIESATSSFRSSGVANSIVGLANKTNNANGALIYGAGNEITNSSSYISAPTSGNSAKSAADSLRTSIKNNPGGAVLAIGGGNKADWTQRTQIIGVANTVQGSKDKPSIYNMIDGYNATLNNSSHIYNIGYRNDFNNENNSIVIGDYHQLTNGKNNIVIGSYDGSYQPADDYTETPEKTTYLTNNKLEDAVILGHNADATVNGGVALGYGSVASTKEGVPGYDPLTGNQSTSTDDIKWKSNWAAVSIGDSAHTRQITNLAAGSNDTDAVNVAQLKAVAEKIGPAMNFVAGDGISIVKKDGVYTISANIKGGSTDTDVVKVDNVEPEKPGEGGNTSGSTGDTPVTPSVNPGNSGNTENPGSADNTSNGKELVITADTKPTKFAADEGAATDVKPGETLNINGDENITTTASTTTASDHGIAHGIAISLNKDIKVDSVTAKTVTSDTVTTKNLSVSESASIGDVTINKGKQGTIDGLKNTAWDAQNITSGRAATEDQVKAATKNAVNYDGDTSKTITLREDTTISNVANTTIEPNSKNAVNAGTVYNETRVKQDGTYVKESNTAGENLSALDNQVTSNTQNINYLNGRVGELGDRINKVGAGAAALAALHPLDFDPDDKWDFAAGVGNYRNATAAAVGLFYRPNERTMFNLGWTMGDNRNMVNGGFSVKFGKSNKYVKYSKAEMASVIDNQSREIAELKAKDAQNAKDNAEMRAEIEALKKQVEALAAKK